MFNTDPMGSAVAAAEEEFVRALIAQSSRARWLLALSNPKRRSSITTRLADDRYLRTEKATRVPRELHTSKEVLAELRRRGAGDMCHVISENAEIDGQDLTLASALDIAVGGEQGTVVICINRTLAYHESETGVGLIFDSGEHQR